MRERGTSDDANGTWKLCVPFHAPDPVAGCDKYLAVNDKSTGVRHTYKTGQPVREPKLVPLELTTGTRARTNKQNGMEKDRKTIAIIDDDNSIRQALKRVLNTAGFQVQVYASAEAFLDAIDSSAAGCAVVDLELGSMSGLELVCHPAVVTAKLPVILISGTTDEGARASAMALGCVEYLRKPFMPIELLGAIFRATQETPPKS